MADVDHVWPDTFDALLRSWLISERLTDKDVELIPSKEYGQNSSFADRDLEYSWREFHRKSANLQILHKTCHRLVTGGKA